MYIRFVRGNIILNIALSLSSLSPSQIKTENPKNIQDSPEQTEREHSSLEENTTNDSKLLSKAVIITH